MDIFFIKNNGLSDLLLKQEAEENCVILRLCNTWVIALEGNRRCLRTRKCKLLNRCKWAFICMLSWSFL